MQRDVMSSCLACMGAQGSDLKDLYAAVCTC